MELLLTDRLGRAVTLADSSFGLSSIKKHTGSSVALRKRVIEFDEYGIPEYCSFATVFDLGIRINVIPVSEKSAEHIIITLKKTLIFLILAVLILITLIG